MERAGRLIGKLRIPSDTADLEHLALRAWVPAVGRRIALHTRAVRLVRDSLVVECEDLIWQKQLFSLRSHIIRNLAGILGEGIVVSLDFRPMTPRRAPQVAHGLFAGSELHQVPVGLDDADGIQDPVFRRLYLNSRRKSAKAAQ